MQGDKGTRCKSVTTAITVIGFTISRDTYRSVFCKKLSGRLEGKQKQNHFDLFRMRLPYGGRFLRYLLVSIYKKEEKYETDTKRERRFKKPINRGRNDSIWNAGCFDVLFKDHHGNTAKHSCSWDADHGLYLGLSQEGIVSYLCICTFKWCIFRFCNLVDPIFVYLDHSLGSYHAAAKENADRRGKHCVSAGVLLAWVGVWNIVCTDAGTALWI